MSQKLFGQLFAAVGMYGGFGLLCYGAWRINHTFGIIVMGVLFIAIGYQAYQNTQEPTP